VTSPEKLAPNIFYHSLIVPKIGWLTTGYQGCIRAVRRKLREIQPDIVHGQGTERDCAITAIFSGFPNVLTIHGNMRTIAKLAGARPFSYNWLGGCLEAFTIPRSQGVVCITRYTQEAVGGLALKTWLVPNAVDQNFFSITSTPDRVPTILCTGVVCSRKNQNALIQALDPLAKEKKFQIVFLGSTSVSESYGAAFFDLLKSRAWCRHEGFVGREKLREYFAGATMLVLPSLEDNCPMVVLEAMAAGVPVVAAKVGGVPDLVEDGVNGLMCDPHNAQSMRSAVEKLLDDPLLAQRMAVTARRSALERFHPKTVAERHVAIYREVLSRSS
jgi:glycosyltransferase involved in cell wall biosynthesis